MRHFVQKKKQSVEHSLTKKNVDFEQKRDLRHKIKSFLPLTLR